MTPQASSVAVSLDELAAIGGGATRSVTRVAWSRDLFAAYELEDLVEEAVATVAAEEGLTAELEQTFALDPLALDPALVAVLEGAATAEGAAARRMPSGAGHDAMVIARHVPAAMLFVPSRGGVSHSPDEDSRPEHVELGMRVLASALRETLGR